MLSNHLLDIVNILALIVVSGLFSGAESALLSLDRLRLNFLVQKKRRGAAELEEILDNPDTMLSAVLIGNNIINIAVSVFAAALFLELFGPERGELFTILILTPVLLIFAEIIPKTYATRHSESLSFLLVRPLRLVMIVLMPIAWVVGGISRFFTNFFSKEEERVISEEEIRTIIAAGEQSGVVNQEKQQMLHGVFELSSIQVRDVMIPRTEVVGMVVTASFAEALRIARESRHSRFPVFEGSIDSVVGIIHSKDILDYLDRPADFALARLVRPPYFVPEGKRIGSLLQSLRRRRVHMAVVVDEYGGVEGVVTMEDIVEQIVGEIQDEYDTEEDPCRDLGGGRYLVDGSAPLRLINRRFALHLSEEHVTTVAGFLLRLFGHIPQEGETCTANGVTFTVRSVVDRRIETLEMLLPPEAEGEVD